MRTENEQQTLDGFLDYLSKRGCLGPDILQQCQFVFARSANILTITAPQTSARFVEGAYLEHTCRSAGEYWWNGDPAAIPRISVIFSKSESLH